MGSDNQAGQLNLPPGFRFHPSDEELLVHYLCKKSAGHTFALRIIAEVDIYKFDPWNLPDKALFGEKEWFFFSPRDRKYPNGSRPNRAAGSGYWKATGSDKPILSSGSKVGVKKALVFYIGKAPKGTKTNWIMHEYRLADGSSRAAKKKGSLKLDDWVLCRIYKKSFGGSPNQKPTPTTTIQTASTTEMARERNDQPSPSCFEGIILASLPDMDQRKIINNNNSMGRTQLPSPNLMFTNKKSMLMPVAPLLNFHHDQNEPLYTINEHDEFKKSCTSTSRFAEDIHSTFSKIRPRQHESILQDQIGGGLGFLDFSNNLPTTFSQMDPTAPSTLRTSSPFANGLGPPSYLHRP